METMTINREDIRYSQTDDTFCQAGVTLELCYWPANISTDQSHRSIWPVLSDSVNTHLFHIYNIRFSHVWSPFNVFACVIRKCSFHRCHEDREYLWMQFDFLSHHQVESSLRLKLAKRLWSAHAGAPFLNISLLALIGVQRFTCNCPWK